MASQAPTDWNAEDQKRFENLKARSTWAELPSLNRSMWAGDFRSSVDVSDYNDRYLVTPFPSMAWYGLYLASGWHTVAFFVCILRPIYLANFDAWSLLGYFLISMPALFMLGLTFFASRASPPVFNRQAQVVHVVKSGRVINLPWRDIRPFTNFTPTQRLLVFRSKTPQFIKDNPDTPYVKRYLGRNLPQPAGSMMLESTDGVDVESNLQRLEFMRRYMEQGVSAIQPSPDVTPYKPKNHPMERARAEGLSFYRVFMECVYWFGAGPLMDLWIKGWRSTADWPEEVYRLCAPGADLSGFDTTSVHPDPDVFYRYDFQRSGYYLCNRDGERID